MTKDTEKNQGDNVIDEIVEANNDTTEQKSEETQTEVVEEAAITNDSQATEDSKIEEVCNSPKKTPTKAVKTNETNLSKKRVATFSIIGLVAIAVLVGFFIFGGGPDRVNYDTDGYIELGKYKGLEVNPIEVTITDDEVNVQIAQELEAAAEQVTIDVVEDGSTAVIDYVGTKDGEAFDGGTAEAYSLEIGSGSFIDGFEEGLIGVEKGETVVLDLTFPDDYTEESLAGADVEFEVTVNEITKYETPLLDDEFASAQGYNSVAKYEEGVKKSLEEAAYMQAEYDEKLRLLYLIVEDSEFLEYPEAQLSAMEEQIKDSVEEEAELYGYTFEDYVEQAMQMTTEEFDETITDYAKSALQEELVVYAIAQAEDITVNDEDVDEYIEESLVAQGLTEEGFEEATGGESFLEYYGEDSIYFAIYVDKVMERVIELGVEIE